MFYRGKRVDILECVCVCEYCKEIAYIKEKELQHEKKFKSENSSGDYRNTKLSVVGECFCLNEGSDTRFL